MYVHVCMLFFFFPCLLPRLIPSKSFHIIPSHPTPSHPIPSPILPSCPVLSSHITFPASHFIIFLLSRSTLLYFHHHSFFSFSPLHLIYFFSLFPHPLSSIVVQLFASFLSNIRLVVLINSCLISRGFLSCFERSFVSFLIIISFSFFPRPVKSSSISSLLCHLVYLTG